MARRRAPALAVAFLAVACGWGPVPAMGALRWGDADLAFALTADRAFLARRYNALLPTWWRNTLRGTVWLERAGNNTMPQLGASPAPP